MALSVDDVSFLERSVSLASRFQDSSLCTPFGAVVVRDGLVLGESHSRVVELRDPSAHAEVLAIRSACARTDSHLLSGATLYCSGFPCPLCLSVSRWAEVSRIVYAATLSDSEGVGFEDASFYRDLECGFSAMNMQFVSGPPELRLKARQLLRDWKQDWLH